MTRAQPIYRACLVLPSICLASVLQCALAQEAPSAVADEGAIDEIIVTSSRREQTISEIPRSVRVFDAQALDVFLEQTSNVQQILGKAIPGFAPPVTEGSAGSLSLRGRDPLYLIDGIPVASNTNFSRFLDKFDPLTLERVEVVYGPTALYGAGATGGVIQFFTKTPETEGLHFQAGAQVRSYIADEDAFDGDGTSPKIHASVSGRVNDWFSLVAYASFEDVRGTYRAQGDLLTGRSQFAEDTTFFGKGVFDIAQDQRITVSINDTSLEPSNRLFELASVPAGDGTQIAGASPTPFSYAEPPTNEFFFASANYQHDNLFGGQLSALYYTSESEFLNPGSDIRPLLMRFGGPFPDTWPGLWQTGRTTDETGLRVQYARDITDRINVAVGADYNDAESDSLLPISTEANFDQTLFFDAATQAQQTPPYTIEALGAFVEASYVVTDRLTVSGGLRWDDFDYTVVGPYNVVFTFVPGTRPGGSGSADDTSFNIGATYDITDSLTVFGNYSEGFTIPSLGFIGNNVAPGVPVSDSDLVAPVITESYEIGVRGTVYDVDYSFAFYDTSSDFSTAVGVDPATGLIIRDRAPVEIMGIEASAGWRATDRLTLDASVAWVEGEVDPNDDGNFIDISTQDVPPIKLSVQPRFELSETLTVFGQILWVDSRDDGFLDGTDANPADNYTLFDAGLNWAAYDGDYGSGSLGVQVQNLLNEEYVPAGEATFIPGRIFSGPGRSITLSYLHDF
ncbi:MAG: TonB-dependent receptor [Pseudomonadota bacterium]